MACADAQTFGGAVACADAVAHTNPMACAAKASADAVALAPWPAQMPWSSPTPHGSRRSHGLRRLQPLGPQTPRSTHTRTKTAQGLAQSRGIAAQPPARFMRRSWSPECASLRLGWGAPTCQVGHQSKFAKCGQARAKLGKYWPKSTSVECSVVAAIFTRTSPSSASHQVNRPTLADIVAICALQWPTSKDVVFGTLMHVRFRTTVGRVCPNSRTDMSLASSARGSFHGGCTTHTHTD